MSQFEDTLVKQEFKVNIEACQHTHSHTLFYQECKCCDDTQGYSYSYKKDLVDVKSKELTWTKNMYCLECTEGHISNLLCGGHYSNIRVYKGEEDVSSEFIETLPEIDPNERVYLGDMKDWFEDVIVSEIEENLSSVSSLSGVKDFKFTQNADFRHPFYLRLLRNAIFDRSYENTSKSTPGLTSKPNPKTNSKSNSKTKPKRSSKPNFGKSSKSSKQSASQQSSKQSSSPQSSSAQSSSAQSSSVQLSKSGTGINSRKSFINFEEIDFTSFTFIDITFWVELGDEMLKDLPNLKVLNLTGTGLTIPEKHRENQKIKI